MVAGRGAVFREAGFLFGDTKVCIQGSLSYRRWGSVYVQLCKFLS